MEVVCVGEEGGGQAGVDSKWPDKVDVFAKHLSGVGVEVGLGATSFKH